MTADENVRFVQDARFNPVRFRDAYDMAAVDDLLDQLAAAFGVGRSVHGIVDAARFPLTKWREGYSVEQVDAFLAEVRRRGEARPA